MKFSFLLRFQGVIVGAAVIVAVTSACRRAKRSCCRKILLLLVICRENPPKAFTVHLWFECGGERKHSPHVSCGESHHSVRVPSPSSKVWYYLYLHIKIISANISLMIILAGLTRVPHRKHPSRSTFSIVSVNVPVEKRLKTIRYAKMTNSLKQKIK